MTSAATIPIIPVITMLSSRIIRILGCNPGPMTLQGTNTYLIGTGAKRILLDTGDANVSNYVQNLAEVLRSEKASVDKILVTHWHHDHIGGVPDVQKLTEAKNSSVWKFPRTDATDEYPDISAPIEKLKDGAVFSVEGATLRVIHTPGHTTDHVVVKLNEENAVFSGDCILGEGTAVFEDLYDYMNSLETILGIKPDVIYPGHGNVVNDPVDKIQYYIDHRNKREAQILEVLQKQPTVAFSAMDIVKIVYKETPEQLWPAAAFNVGHHLQKLTKQGIIVKVIEDNEDRWQIKAPSSSL